MRGRSENEKRERNEAVAPRNVGSSAMKRDGLLKLARLYRCGALVWRLFSRIAVLDSVRNRAQVEIVKSLFCISFR